MSGTKAGGQLARETNYRLHGENFYAKIGAIGGRTSHGAPKGFAANRELARIAGAKGGHISRRTKKEK